MVCLQNLDAKTALEIVEATMITSQMLSTVVQKEPASSAILVNFAGNFMIGSALSNALKGKS